FFSSRRRHTRCYRDWSSDVCSSDLEERLRQHKARHTEAGGQQCARLRCGTGRTGRHVEKQPVSNRIEAREEAREQEERLCPRVPPVPVDLEKREEEPASRRENRHEPEDVEWLYRWFTSDLSPCEIVHRVVC